MEMLDLLYNIIRMMIIKLKLNEFIILISTWHIIILIFGNKVKIKCY